MLRPRALGHFRNSREARLEADARFVVLTGPNGAGKTNLLEALSLLAPGRGLRRARPREMTRLGAERWTVTARLDTPYGTVDIGTGLGEGDRRAVHIDGAARRGRETGPAAVWLTPQMDRLFLDGAGARRRFLDRLVLAVDPAHAGRVQAYETAMRQRLALLRAGTADGDWLAALERSMAERGIAVAASRRDLVERLRAALASAGGPFPKAQVALAGAVDAWLEEGPALGAEDRLVQALAAGRARDAETGRTGSGPHRSDLTVADAGRGMPAADCSTGEQKALLVALVLASVRLAAQPPVLLLDDVAAYLDEGRRLALFDEIGRLGCQAWLTGADPGTFAPLAGRALHVGIENAVLTPLPPERP
ncbi:MAG: DNA replication/repair protein RecF [Acidobacteria bacterium]|nr:DNA replication/repair protein RecF [Acidobacteriota bacterium]